MMFTFDPVYNEDKEMEAHSCYSQRFIDYVLDLIWGDKELSGRAEAILTARLCYLNLCPIPQIEDYKSSIISDLDQLREARDLELNFIFSALDRLYSDDPLGPIVGWTGKEFCEP